MHVHNVSTYAPAGYHLHQTLYEGGCTRHVFASPGKPDLVCECTPQTPADEQAALEAFRTAHAPAVPRAEEPEATGEPMAPPAKPETVVKPRRRS